MMSYRFFLSFLCLFFISFSAFSQELKPEDEKALRQLEDSVTALKTRVRQSKEDLRQLENAVLRGKITGSKAFIKFENQAEGLFKFVSAEFHLDGKRVSHVERPKDGKVTEVIVFDQDLPSGEHLLEARIKYRGSDDKVFSAFRYFEDHRFELETRKKFDVEHGKTTLLRLSTRDKGYFESDIKERLYLDIEILKDWGTQPPE